MAPHFSLKKISIEKIKEYLALEKFFEHFSSSFLDIDECEETDGRICGNPATVSCENKDNGFDCVCKDGYVMKNDVCVGK